MVVINIHLLALICFIIGIFCVGMWLGYRLAEGTPSASHNTGMDAIALWEEAIGAFTHGNIVRWFGENGKRITAVVAQRHHT